jgi:hypothetical protein
MYVLVKKHILHMVLREIQYHKIKNLSLNFGPQHPVRMVS